MKKNSNSQFILFKTEDENISVDVRMDDETVWLTQEQMAMLFDKAKSTISEHIKHIFEEGELHKKVSVRKFRIATQQPTDATKIVHVGSLLRGQPIAIITIVQTIFLLFYYSLRLCGFA